MQLPVGPYEGTDNCYKWQRHFSAAAAAPAPPAVGDFMFQQEKVCDRSLLFQGQVLSCGTGTASLLWR